MGIQVYLLTWWRGRFIGEDVLGNKYYEDKKHLRFGRPRRWVIYKGKAEASKVPSDWHGWLHHMMSDPPRHRQPYPWEKQHCPNLTGTPLAQKPKGWRKHPKPSLIKDYEPWQPE
jgi:NADH:ubiquinone oxidoreductase subunit